MKKEKRLGLIAGLTFIIATAAGVASLPFILPLGEANAVENIANLASDARFGGLLVLLMGMACANIAVWIYPIIKDESPGLATASVVFRGIEGALLMVMAAILLALGSVGAQASFALGFYDALGQVVTFAFCFGAMMYYLAMWQQKVVPRWLSGWGIVAIALHTLVTALTFVGVESFGAVNIALNAPIALQEMVLAVWLIIKGFRPAETTLTI